MSVIPIMIPSAEGPAHPDNAIDVFDEVRLVGTGLISKEGLLLAELVEDEEGRHWWKSTKSERLYPEVAIFGMGNRP